MTITESIVKRIKAVEAVPPVSVTECMELLLKFMPSNPITLDDARIPQMSEIIGFAATSPSSELTRKYIKYVILNGVL